MDATASRSKKRSGASSKSKPRSALAFFIDRSLGRHKISNALRQAGVEVHIHDDHFPPNAKDEEWLREAGRKGWAVLTKDRRIRYRTPAVAAIVAARVRTFVLTAGDLQGAEMAEIFVKALPAMNRFAARNPPPFIARITRGGSIALLFAPVRSR